MDFFFFESNCGFSIFEEIGEDVEVAESEGSRRLRLREMKSQLHPGREKEVTSGERKESYIRCGGRRNEAASAESESVTSGGGG